MKLSAKVREKTGTGASKKLRIEIKDKSKFVENRDARVPAVIYGKNENLSVSLLEKDVNKFIQEVGGSTRLIDLEIENAGETLSRKVILQELQQMGFRNRVQHIDFREVDEQSVLELQVPIQTVGQSKGVKLGGVLQIIRHAIPVTCKVKDIPEQIDIDITELDFGQSIHVLDIPYPQGVQPVVHGRNFTIMTLTGASQEEPEETTAPEEEAGEGESSAN